MGGKGWRRPEEGIHAYLYIHTDSHYTAEATQHCKTIHTPIIINFLNHTLRCAKICFGNDFKLSLINLE